MKKILSVWICMVLVTLFGLEHAVAQIRLLKPKTFGGKVVVVDADIKELYIRSKHSGSAMVLPDGSFHISVKVLPETLKFDGMNFYQTLRVLTNENDIVEDAIIKMVAKQRDLGEVVVSTGYQRIKPNETNGDISLIDNKSINNRTGTNILDRLLGQTSGLTFNIGKTNANPQNKTGISVRGLGTINGPLDPLIVLDGFIYEGDINNINPFDIENVSILKDASAASIWGARAGNGVIVLTSKRAKLNQALDISFNVNTTLNTLPDLSRYPQMSIAETIEAERFLFDKGYYNSRIATGYFALTPAVELLLAKRNGKITDAQLETALDEFRKTDIKKEWLDEFYTRALLQQYALNIRTGTANHAFSLSGGYDRGYDQNYATSARSTLRLTDQLKINPKFTLNSSLTLTFSDAGSGRPSFGSIREAQKLPYRSLRDNDGNPVPLATEFRSAYTDTAGMGKLLDWKYYPTEEYKHNIANTNREEILGSVMLSYRILPFLNVEASYQGQRQITKTENLTDEDSYVTRGLINSFSQVNRSTGIVKYNIPRGSVFRSDNTYTSSSTGRIQFNLDKNIGSSSLNLLAGMEVRDVKVEGDGNVFYGYKADPLSYQNVDYLGIYTHIVTGDIQQVSPGANLTSLQNRFVSFYANAAYTYAGKYRLSGSVRRDGSNVFGASTNDRWKPLWSVGGGWSISKEGFYDVSWLPELRLTVTYGKSGNVDLSKTATATAAYASNSLSTLPYVRIRQINNPELRWEQLAQLNMRLDFASRKNRLNGSISVYWKKGTDLYGSYLYDYTTWGNSAELTRNVADMEGKGIDLELASKNIIGQNFQWSTNLFFSLNKSKTVKYYTTNNTLMALFGGGKQITPLVGYPLYAVSAYQWGGLDAAGNPQGYVNGALSTNYSAIANEARLTGNNIRFFGAASPTYFGSLLNTFAYQNFSLSFNLNFRMGYFATKRSISYNGLASSGTEHPDYSLRWKKPGDENFTDVPSFLYPINTSRDAFYSSSEVNVIRADNIRLDYVNLTYRVNAQHWKFPFRSLDVFLNGSNLGIVWKASSAVADPDYQNQIGLTKSMTLGVRGNF